MVSHAIPLDEGGVFALALPTFRGRRTGEKRGGEVRSYGWDLDLIVVK